MKSINYFCAYISVLAVPVHLFAGEYNGCLSSEDVSSSPVRVSQENKRAVLEIPHCVVLVETVKNDKVDPVPSTYFSLDPELIKRYKVKYNKQDITGDKKSFDVDCPVTEKGVEVCRVTCKSDEDAKAEVSMVIDLPDVSQGRPHWKIYRVFDSESHMPLLKDTENDVLTSPTIRFSLYIRDKICRAGTYIINRNNREAAYIHYAIVHGYERSWVDRPVKQPKSLKSTADISSTLITM